MYYGFDIGGTKIALGAFDKDLKLQWETRVPTPRESYDEFLTAIAALVSQADERFGGKGSVDLGAAGKGRVVAHQGFVSQVLQRDFAHLGQLVIRRHHQHVLPFITR
jgi:predicted NBD/HSP70 family sugar kinase